MCGRIACALSPRTLCCLSCPLASEGLLQSPRWIVVNNDASNGACPVNCNIAPSQNVPVICNSRQLFSAGCTSAKSNDEDGVVALPMFWGLIPSYYHGVIREFHMSTINCRSETILSKPTFSKPFSTGNRCVVVADGYYEWKKGSEDQKKHPYFIYNPKSAAWWTKKEVEQDPADHVPLLFAGIFDVNMHVCEGPFVSVSVVTVPTKSTPTEFIHDRMPAIFSNYKDAMLWLNSGGFGAHEAISLLKPSSDVSFHQVPLSVNYAQNKSFDLCKPILESSTSKVAAVGGIEKWLMSKGSKRPDSLQEVKTEPVPTKVKKFDTKF